MAPDSSMISPSAYRKQRQRSAQAARDTMLENLSRRIETLERHMGLPIQGDAYSRSEMLASRNAFTVSMPREPEAEKSPEKAWTCIGLHELYHASGNCSESRSADGASSDQGGVAIVSEALDSLLADLSGWLYHGRDCVQDDVSKTMLELEQHNVKQTSSDEMLRRASSLSTPPADLLEISGRTGELLQHLQRAGELACSIDESVDDAGERVDAFLQDYYSLLDPVGVAERLAQNQDIEDELDELDVGWLGHLFVFDRPSFQDRLADSRGAVRDELTNLAIECPSHPNPMPISMQHYHQLYDSHCEEAYLWQEHVPDCDDESSLLLRLLKALRKLVKST